MNQRDRRRKFVALECPFCGRVHDVLVDGGRHRLECGRWGEALAAGGTVEARVWGTAAEGAEVRPARLA